MQATTKPILIDALGEHERREFAKAAKELVRLKLSHAAATHGIITQNMYTWMRGKDGVLGNDRQKILLSMFGITPWGQLVANVTHAWVISGREQAPFADFLLSRENTMQKMTLQLSHIVTPAGRQLVGAEVRWTAPYVNAKRTETRERRLILTAVSGMWESDDFVTWLIQLFEQKSATRLMRRTLESDSIELSVAAATNIWRFYLKAKRLVGGNRAMSSPRNSLLPFTQDVVDEQAAQESPMAVLQDITPRFAELAKSSAELREVRVGPRDLALIRRANAILQATETKQ